MATSSPPSSSSSPPSSSSSSTFDSSSHTLVTPDLSLHYDLHGSPSAEEKLFLIMGLLTDGAAWAYQVDYFARRGFQVVTYDNRGVAQSSTPKNPLSYTTTQMADDAVRLANHLGWEKFHLVGVSMGGMIALELCLQVPFTRIASLTLIVTHAGGWGGIAPFVGVRRMAKSIFTTDKKRKLDTLMRLLYSEETLKDSELANKLRGHHESRLATAIPPKLPAIVGHTLAVYRHFVSYPNLLRIRYAPFTTLIVVGSEDQLVRRSNSFMLGRVLGARVYEVQHGGHGLLAQYPDQINEEMMKHFKGKNAGKPMEGNSSSPDEDDESGNYTVESQEALMDGDDESSSNEDTSPRPYTLEEHALSLFCKHSVHCSIHNLSGFLTGFIPGFIFRWIFYDSIALSSPTHPVSRLDQSVRFGLLVGVVRSSIRALRCIWHAHRARQWIKKYSLRQTETPRNNNPSELRKGIPPGAGFNFPSHSILLLCAFAFITWQQRLLAGIF